MCCLLQTCLSVALVALISGQSDRCKRDGVDYPGADISDAAADSFEDCADRCGANAGCASITYRPADRNCWLKNRNGGGGPNPKEGLISMNIDCSMADRYNSADDRCVETGIDYPGADIKDFKANNLEQCRDLCNDFDDCFSVTFRPSDNNCWLKNTPYGGGASPKDGLISVNVPCGFDDCRRVGVDYPGADISDAASESFEDCVSRCQDTTDCVSVTYRPSDRNCWLKNRKGGGGPNRKERLISMNIDCSMADKYNSADDRCVETGTDYPGADIKDFKANNLEQCRDLCNDFDDCFSVTFRPSDNNCWLKNTPYGGGASPKDGLISVNVPCPSIDYSDCYEDGMGMFLDCAIISQEELVSPADCITKCNLIPACETAVTSPVSSASRKCFLVSAKVVTSRDGWSAASKNCFGETNGN